MTKNDFKLLAIFLIPLSLFSHAHGEEVNIDETDAKDVFVTGGYGAAFGGAVGLATIPFVHNSMLKDFRIVAGGASIGFVLGSIYGFYSVYQKKTQTVFNYPQDQENEEMKTENEDGKKDSLYTELPPEPTEGKLESPVYYGALVNASGLSSGVHIGIPDFVIGDKFFLMNVAEVRF